MTKNKSSDIIFVIVFSIIILVLFFFVNIFPMILSTIKILSVISMIIGGIGFFISINGRGNPEIFLFLFFGGLVVFLISLFLIDYLTNLFNTNPFFKFFKA